MSASAPVVAWRPERDAIDRRVPGAASRDAEAPVTKEPDEGFDDALARTTHLCIGAHPDDVEWIGYHGVLACFDDDAHHFTGCVVTDGAGSSRGGPFADVDDATLVRIRRDEQRRAAELGRYAALVQLGHPSATLRDAGNATPAREIVGLLRATRPDTVYLHAPTDRHATHVATVLRSLDALRRVDVEDGWRPAQVLGVEGWGGLEWLAPDDRVELDVSARPRLFEALIGAHQSQLAGGKPYDRAMVARWEANATFAEPRAHDRAERLALAVDLTRVARADGPTPSAFVDGLLARAAAAVRGRLDAASGA